MWSNIFWDFEFAGKMVKLNQLGNIDKDIYCHFLKYEKSSDKYCTQCKKYYES